MSNPIKTKYQYISFLFIETTGKTTRWSVVNNMSSANLGKISWYSNWRQYCFSPAPDTVFSSGCMTDILDFIKQLKEQREQTKNDKGNGDE
jgi:hypothetical protein